MVFHGAMIPGNSRRIVVSDTLGVAGNVCRNVFGARLQHASKVARRVGRPCFAFTEERKGGAPVCRKDQRKPTMGIDTRAAEAAANSRPGGAPDASGESRQGTSAGRQVQVRTGASPGPSVRERSAAVGTGAAAEERPGLRSRRVSFMGSAPWRSRPNQGPAGISVGEVKSITRRPANELELCARVPGLERATLTSNSGELLFRGLRHGVFAADGISGQRLRQHSDEQCRSFFRFLLSMQGGGAQERAQIIEENLQRLRRSPEDATLVASLARGSAVNLMGHEVAAAALTADPEKARLALDGEVVAVDLYSITLFSASETEQWVTQSAALAWLGVADESATVCLQGPDGATRSCQVKVRTRQYALSATGHRVRQPSYCMPQLELQALLGPMDQWHLGGLAQARVVEMKSRVEALKGDTGPLRDERQRLQRQARTLSEAGQQLKALWAKHGGWPHDADGDGQFKAAARVALLGHLMGATPLLNSNDSNLVRQLDAETRFLATVAYNSDGRVPPLDLSMDVWRATDFRQ